MILIGMQHYLGIEGSDIYFNLPNLALFALLLLEILKIM
jgi:hypothetical protein